MGQKSTIIDYYYCDEQLAESLGLKGRKQTNLFKCREGKEDCLNCLACIVSINGEKTHINPKR